MLIKVPTLDELIEACRTGFYRGGKVIAKFLEIPYLDIVVLFPDGHTDTFRA